ncbi:hypothetical protein RHSIM_Rhsim04G0001400 [Rhododendron simsii]|uniref:Uncharacterized protein n=1 Tax=Rhododendron simsii TaxID=118357 RepID=A0A834H2R3_RHOSS|nr:hypothetical protein RHSIM_Rhsim04G0001400 [Rhododendron simsii]
MDFHRALQLRKLPKPGGIHGTGLAAIVTGLFYSSTLQPFNPNCNNDFPRLSRLEGIIPALETSHALAYMEKLCPITLANGTKLVLNCSDEDVQTAVEYLQV